MPAVRVVIEPPSEWPTDGRNAIEDLAASVSVLAEQMGLGPRSRVTVELPPRCVQRRVLNDLPQVDQRRLNMMVAQQATRYFRGRGVLQTAVAASNGCAVGVGADAALIGAVLNAIQRAGAVVQGVEYREHGTVFDLTPAEYRLQVRRRRWQRIRRGAVAAIGVLAVAVTGYAWWVRQSLVNVEKQLAELKAPLAAVGTARTAMVQAAEAVGWLAPSSEARHRLLRDFAGVSGALPDSAYLTGLQLRSDGSVELRGLARRPTSVVASLQDARFGEVTLDPVLGGGAPGVWEPFVIRAKANR